MKILTNEAFTLNYSIVTTHTENNGLQMETYGVRIEKVVSVQFPNISTQKEKVMGFLEMLKRGQVTPISAAEVVEDFLEI